MEFLKLFGYRLLAFPRDGIYFYFLLFFLSFPYFYLSSIFNLHTTRSYEDFYNRYRLLCKRAEIVDWNVKATCTNIVRNWLQDDDKYRFGHTQIFFRAGQVAYLEQLRTDLRRKYIVVVQSSIRRFIYRSKFLRLKRTALGIQTYARGLLARR